jgi:hypothetical protein
MLETMVMWSYVLNNFGWRKRNMKDTWVLVFDSLYRPCVVCPSPAELLFSNVAQCSILFLFGNNCLNIDYLGSKRSSRKVQSNCAIIFWFHLHLVLHACVNILIWWESSFYIVKVGGKFWKLNMTANTHSLVKSADKLGCV